MRNGRLRRVISVMGLTAAVGLAAATTGWASAGPGSQDAAVLIQQAVALMANGNPPVVVLERIDDAIKAPMNQGTDLGPVRQAAALLEPLVTDGSGVLPPTVAERVRALLEQAGGTAPPPTMATGTATGTTVVLDEYRPARGVSDRGDAVLLVMAGAAAVTGAVLARRLGPQHSVHDLRRNATSAGKELTP